MEYLQYKMADKSFVKYSMLKVLNLIINGISSIQKPKKHLKQDGLLVLNLIINGISSIPLIYLQKIISFV